MWFDLNNESKCEQMYETKLDMISIMITIDLYFWYCFDNSRHKNVWSSSQDKYGGNDGEGSEENQTKSVKNHGCKSPVSQHCCWLLVISKLFCYYLNEKFY